MCGIIGIFNRKDAFKLMIGGLRKIRERGKDCYGFFDGENIVTKRLIGELTKTESENILGHNLHAVVDIVPQPIKHKNMVLAANCEIYNWKELKREYNIRARNDSETLLRLISKIGLKEALDKIRGVYAFALWEDDEITIARDIIGIKPLWYSTKDGFSFSSERKAIEDAIELNPRTIITYNIKNKRIKEYKRPFFKLKPIVDSKEEMKKRLIEAVKIRIPDHKFGLLFSGGIDSILIAKILKDLNADFTAYTASTSKDSPDYIYSKKAAESLKIKWKGIIIKDVEKYAKKVIGLIEDTDVMKVGVGIPLYAACKKAKKDKCKVIFSGSGADELFGGYNRHKNSNQLNKDCYSDILKIYERNTYRDDVISMNNNLELRVPFLDLKLVEYGLRLKEDMKIGLLDNEIVNKKIIREIALDIGIDKRFALRKKKAAQYGSGVDKAISKISKTRNISKSEYLDSLSKKKIMRLGALISGGKDGWYSAYIMKKKNYEISCAITIKSRNKDSYMFHTPNIDIVDLQCKNADIPLITEYTEGEKEKELDDLRRAIKKAIKKYKIEGIITGALYSNYQRERIEKIADELNLKIFSPLWHIDQEQEMRQLLRENFKIIFSSIAGYGFTREWLGKEITEKDVDKLVELNKKYGINVAGEGGEFESLVLDCPLFKRPIKIRSKKIMMEDENTGKCIIHTT